MRTTRRCCLLLAVGVVLVVAGHSRSDDPPPKRPEPLDLVRAMTQAGSTDPEEKARGLLALAKCAPIVRDREVEQLLWRAFTDSNPVVRAAACKATGELSGSAQGYNFASFHVALQDPHKSVRMAALDAMIQRGPSYREAEIRALAGTLDDADVEIRFKAYQNLIRAGEYRNRGLGSTLRLATPALLKKLDTEPPDPPPGEGNYAVLTYAIWALGEIGHTSPQSVPALLRVYVRYPADTKRDKDIRRGVIHAVGRIGAVDGRAIPFLIGILRDAKKPVPERTAACVAIATLGGPTAAPAVPDMVALLKGDAATADPWPTLGTTQPEYVTRALAMLGEVAEPAFDTLVALAQGDEREHTTKAAIEALGQLGPLVQDRALPVLVRLYFGKEKHRLNDDLHRAIIQFGPATVPYLRELLRSGTVEQQTRVAYLIETRLTVDGRSLLPDLERIAADRRHPVSSDAETAARRIRQQTGHLAP